MTTEKETAGTAGTAAGAAGTAPVLALLESNTTGSGREFCAVAQGRGLRPVLLAGSPERYPYAAADGVDTVRLDTGDRDAVLRACAELAERGAGLVGVTSSSEYFMASAAEVAGKLGLPAPDGDAVAGCRRKDRQRELLAAAGVPVPGFRAVTETGEAARAADRLGYPVVLKPVSGSGSVGVRLCADRAEVAGWADLLLSREVDERGAPVPREILVESAVSGPEFSVETFDREVVAVVGKRLGAEPYFVETGHDIPAPVACGVQTELGRTALRALDALGLGWGAAHVELRLGPKGPVVIEVNPRLAGGMIPAAVLAARGVDLVDRVIARASGQPAATAGRGPGHAAVRFVTARRAGEVTAVHGLAEAERAPGVVHAHCTAVPGRRVEITHSFRDRLGCVVATGSGAAEAGARAEAAAGLVRVELAGGGDSDGAGG
ncbi:Biotin carboxylase [Streptomyces zhaozhouensis]|uniref:Biotin carboxylase n=1 Tax=Streptomyces zhaozhouensis TaxID=1300267 RepID=A0A286DMV6_9ACTN|nr:ATP-grasp domain-containing protein [Streptomyces zhaozhouensis]SOD60077.1 Biotin carboxylase [Streptomyces zhaozhouensis]